MKYLSKSKTFLSLSMLMGFQYVQAASITATADAAYFTPPTAAISESVSNGDFFITGASRGQAIGDGADESTLWVMNFRTNRSAFKEFKITNPATLISATLTLKLIPKSKGFPNDSVRIEGLPHIRVNSYPVSREGSIVINLLDHYSDYEIINSLKVAYGQGSFDGMVYMIYQDDAIVSFAKMTLKY